ncbi:MAG TPA: MFS transporter [Chloroflexia bacterium]|nr:MFS transporter [Chloroflexia bacterium]
MPELLRYLKQRDYAAIFGYILFIGMMAVGYYYNLTFVQLGLVDLGTRLVGMSEAAVALHMAGLALVTCVVAVAFGVLMRRRGGGEKLVLKLRISFGVVVAQMLLTAAAPFIRSETLFALWIGVASVALGIGIPTMFSMAVDLVPRQDRGYVAAAITAGAYFAAATLSTVWEIERFAVQVLVVMLPGAAVMGMLAFRRIAFVERLAAQHTLPEFAYGRFVSPRTEGLPGLKRRLAMFIVLMFAIFFVDSLGFLRLLFTPAYMASAWQSPDLSVHLVIGGTHVLGAAIAGVLYSYLNERSLFAWVFGIFAMTHLMYVFDIRAQLGAEGTAPLAMPMLYAVAVSLYTVVNFAIWADLSTPRTISTNTAVGVALSGWASTFLSTALSLQWRLSGMDVDRHLSLVASIAVLFFLGMLAAVYWLGETRRANRANYAAPARGEQA